MKYMILTFGSQDDYDGMAGKPTATTTWTHDDFVAIGAFMRTSTKSWSTPASSSRHAA